MGLANTAVAENLRFRLVAMAYITQIEAEAVIMVEGYYFYTLAEC